MKTINTNKAPEALGPYSHAMVVNNLVFTSGQIPLDTCLLYTSPSPLDNSQSLIPSSA